MGGGFVGLGIALLITMLLSTPPFWPLVIWTLPAILLLALISSLYPLWQLWQVRPAEILRAGSSISSRRATSLGFPFWSFVSPIGVMVLRNLTRSRPRTVITMGSLFFSSILLVLMFSGILALRQTLSGTLLGDFVLVQTAIPQLAGSVFAMLLTFLSVADLLLLQVRERRKEIGLFQAIGWRPGQVQRLFVQEGLTLAILSTLPGVLIALWILSTLHTVQSLIPSPFIALGTILLMVLVAALASIPALRAINRLQISDVLRSE
jgi:ABC-type antimicrobial peptide transport system permease subunit